MARGDPWRLMGGLYIPNSRFLLDTDWNPNDAEWLPDGWTYLTGLHDGGVTIRHAPGFSDHRALRIAVGTTSSDTNFFSSPTQAGGIPRFQFPGPNTRIRLIGYYKKTTGNTTVSIMVHFYNASESTEAFFTIATFTAAQATWLKFDASINVDLQSGIFWDHARIRINVPGGATATTFILDDLCLGYRMTDPSHATQAYDTITARPLIQGLSLSNNQNGRYARTSLGQLRYIDQSGGNTFATLPTRWETATPADRKVFEHALALNRGLLPKDVVGEAIVTAPPNPSPIVVEPFLLDPSTMDWGRIPDHFYACITNEPQFEPLGYLSNVLRGDLTFEEVG